MPLSSVPQMVFIIRWVEAHQPAGGRRGLVNVQRCRYGESHQFAEPGSGDTSGIRRVVDPHRFDHVGGRHRRVA